jgi:hypothetical protein
MDMSVSCCLHSGPTPLDSLILFMILFALPAGAFVLRKHLREATGVSGALIRFIFAAGSIAGPLVAIFTLGFIAA